MKNNHKSLIINHESQSLKSFVNNWDFANPNWSFLPPNFPNIPKNGLSREEGHLLDGIKLAWMASEGRDYLVKTVAKRVAVTAVIIFILVVGGSLIKNSRTGTKTVSAKTVTQTIGGIIESTTSAILRR